VPDTTNLSPRYTGLPFVVWISTNPGDPGEVTLSVSKDSKSPLTSIAIRPEVQVRDGVSLGAADLELLQKWIALNEDVILRYWRGEIEYTEDVIFALRAVR
jgi:hypothetical protein